MANDENRENDRRANVKFTNGEHLRIPYAGKENATVENYDGEKVLLVTTPLGDNVGVVLRNVNFWEIIIDD